MRKRVWRVFRSPGPPSLNLNLTIITGYSAEPISHIRVQGDMKIISPVRIPLRKLPAALLLAGMVMVCAAAARAQMQAPPVGPAEADAAPPSPLYLSLTGRPAASAAVESQHGRTADADAGFYLGGTVGYVFSRNLRAEIEAFYLRDGPGAHSARGSAFDMTFTPSMPASGGASQYGGMARGYWEFGAGGNFTPYVGGGVGLTTVEFDIIVDGARARDEENLLAYEFTAGARYIITPRAALRAGYRMSGTRERRLNPTGADERIHAIEFGIKYRF